MNEKEGGILILGVDPSKNDLSMSLIQHTRLGVIVESNPIIHFDQLNSEEAVSLGLVIEPSDQIKVKQQAFLPSAGTVATMGNIITAQLKMVNEVCKSIGKLFKENGYQGCRTPPPFRNDKAIYRQHKRQRKHK